MSTNPAAGEPTPPPPAAAPPTTGGETTVPEIQSTPDERQMAMFAHWGGMLPFIGILVPMALWAMKMGQSPYIEDQAKESLNLQINVLMLDIITAVTCMIYIGYVLFPSVVLTNALWCFLAGAAAKEGKVYRYPFNIRYIS
jgi:uncharacterized Tic20 family protein